MEVCGEKTLEKRQQFSNLNEQQRMPRCLLSSAKADKKQHVSTQEMQKLARKYLYDHMQLLIWEKGSYMQCSCTGYTLTFIHKQYIIVQ